MTNDQIIAELFFRFRYAKRLLQIDHPTCDFCGDPSVGVHRGAATLSRSMVVARCEHHWITGNDAIQWRVKWDDLEEVSDIVPDEE